MLHYSKILVIATVLAVVPWVSADTIEIESPAQDSTHCIGKPITIAYDVLYRDMAMMASVDVNFVAVNGKTRVANVANSKRPSGGKSWKYSKKWNVPSNLTPGEYNIEFKGTAIVRRMSDTEEYPINREQLIKLAKC
ncbi:hypothetical protein BDF19DRAFT_433364 [Syncephalis fuscata]|nr:hypothetical protein BDF19DRAFT_433364 [Syncephalis fuscata]